MIEFAKACRLLSDHAKLYGAIDMAGEADQVPSDSNVNKTLEVARIIFHVETSLTVVEGSQTLRDSVALQSPNINAASMVDALAEALNGLVLDTAGTEFGVVQVQMRAGGSIEFIAIVVATYLAVKQGVEVVDTLQKVAELGRWLVRALMRAQSLAFTSVHGRVEINPTVTAIGRADDTTADGLGASRRGLIFARPFNMSALLLLAIVNILIAGAVLAVVLTR